MLHNISFMVLRKRLLHQNLSLTSDALQLTVDASLFMQIVVQLLERAFDHKHCPQTSRKRFVNMVPVRCSQRTKFVGHVEISEEPADAQMTLEPPSNKFQ